jgi:hypothetical protein
MKKFEVEAIGLGFNNSDYPGAFTPTIEQLIKSTINGKVLHLFSGSSLIGDERVDLEHPSATINQDVGIFLIEDNRNWNWVLLDPPYGLYRVGSKLKEYANDKSLAGNLVLARALKRYCQMHTDNILWLDICAPMIKGFHRRKLWLCLPGGMHIVRVLSWLERVSKPMF